jgi:cobalamin biosynthetic protein CobC
MTRDHGGDLDRAMTEYGGKDWIDLSTGINRQPYPLPTIAARLWHDLPRAADLADLRAAASALYGLPSDQILPLAGAQAAIQLYPRLGSPGRARILGPTYNEHVGSLSAQGWQTQTVLDPADLAGADLAVIVNPNNPDGRFWRPDDLRRLAKTVGRLIVDESFADPVPELSVAQAAGQDGLIVLRSFGKFWGLAGLRLGFLLAAARDIAQIAALAGPWPVSGPACAIGAAALSDITWQDATTLRLAAETARLDLMASAAGWPLVGGAHLFRTYAAPSAKAAQARLAQARIWSRIFPYSESWIRLGLPGAEPEWTRLQAALATD